MPVKYVNAKNLKKRGFENNTSVPQTSPAGVLQFIQISNTNIWVLSTNYDTNYTTYYFQQLGMTYDYSYDFVQNLDNKYPLTEPKATDKVVTFTLKNGVFVLVNTNIDAQVAFIYEFTQTSFANYVLTITT